MSTDGVAGGRSTAAPRPGGRRSPEGTRRRGAGARGPVPARGAVPCLLALALAVLGAPAPLPAAPEPLPTPRGLVSDFTGILDPATTARLTRRLEDLRRRTGAEIAIVLVESTAPDDAFDYAMRLAEAWKPGAPDKDNGVLFLTAVRDRALFILVGYGLEGALPDGLIGEIRDRDVLPRYRQGDYAGGLVAGVERLAAIIAREYGVDTGAPATDAIPRRSRRPAPPALLLLVLLLILFFVILPSLSAAAGSGRRRRTAWHGGSLWRGGFGGGGFGGPGGGFGGFGGGGFGGGGAGGRW